MVRSATKHHFDGGFRILLGRRCLPRVTVEPVGRSGQTLSNEETRPEFLMLRAREFDVVGELVDQPVAKVRSRPGDSDDHGRRVWSVLGTIIEFPRGAEDDGSDAIEPRLVGREEILPGLNGESAEIVGNGVIESKSGRAVWASDQQNTGDDCRREHCENECTTHPRSLPILDAVGPCRVRDQYKNHPRSLRDAVAKKEQE